MLYPEISGVIIFLYQTTSVDENLFTALSLAASLLQSIALTSQEVNAVTAQTHAQNLEFVGLYGNLTMTSQAQLQHHFSIWDYDTSSGYYTAVMETHRTSTKWRNLKSIDWPGGFRPPSDTCEFGLCMDDDEGM